MESPNFDFYTTVEVVRTKEHKTQIWTPETFVEGKADRSQKTIPQRQEQGERTALQIYPRTDTHRQTYQLLLYFTNTNQLPRLSTPSAENV